MMEDITASRRAALDGGHTVDCPLSFGRSLAAGEPEAVDAVALLEDVAHLTAPRWRDRAQAEGRSIALQVEGVDAPLILGWASVLREALTNLVFNAVDALPDGGEIRLSARPAGPAGRLVELEIADTGVGTPPEVRADALEPFFITKGDRGSGLGLAMVFGVVQQHGGSLAIDAAEGAGTRIRLALPSASEPPNRAAAPAPAAPRTSSGKHVLVVDDAALVRLTVKILTKEGYVVEAATSGEEALERLSATSFDLVVTDLGMGEGINGWDLADRIHQLRPGLPVVLATGWGAEIDPDDARARGVRAVVAKPYRASDLTRTIAEVLGQRLDARPSTVGS
jgi:CheY-like chemotaxis protein